MNNRPGIILKKPVALGQREINVNWRDFGVGIIKVGANAVTGNISNLPENIVDIGAAIGVAQEPGEIAWLLICSALTQAMVNVIGDNQDLLQEANQGKEVKEDKLREILEQLFNQCLERLEIEEIPIYQDFFECPQNFAVVAEIKTPFSEWLQAEFNLKPAPAETISNRLPNEFLYAVYSEFDQHSDKYAKLQTALDNPFSKAVEKERKKELSWRRYSAWLQKQVEERMFDEAFGLKQVYVPLRAFYEEKIESDDDDFGVSNRRYQSVEKNVKRYVVNLQDELQTWLDKADKTDAMRVISGGPGSGKSSFAKMLAATLAETGKILVLFIPLHLFNPEADVVEAIGKFIESMRDIPLPANPLKSENFVDKLLIIFDGLDELAMQGEMAERVAQKFISEVRRLVDLSNQSKTHLLALIGGREIVVQRNESEFRKSKQILHILPYFINKEEIKDRNFIDDNNLLQIDQRQIWWEYYGKAKGFGYSKLPDELDRGNLREITAQPLLNYLVALSYEKNTVKFTENSNLNEIYADLITKVYQRVWGKNHNPQIQGVKEQDFVRILESIAIAAWHGGDIRITTLSEIEKYCDSKIIDRILNIFNQDKKASFTRLLTAFYFRQHGVKNREETFEFTHKSFGEYLAAKGIVRQLTLIHKNLQKYQEDSDDGWNEKQALENWAKICGLTAMDEYIFKFIVDEIRWQKDNSKVDIGAWQQTMCDLISYMLKHGMPMERLEISTFQEANRQARNAKEALLAVLNACARITEKVSQIKWHSSVINNVDGKEKEYFTDFGNWISRLRGQRVNDDDVFCLNCLSFLDLQNCIFTFQDFYKANLLGTNLQEAYFQDANLLGANLQKANLEGANLQWVNLQWVNLEGANLQWANLQRVNLHRANLQWVNLEGVNLQWANLQWANLQKANLEGANLQGANLQWANLQKANLEGANLQWADVTGTILQGKDLTPLTQYVDEDSD
ncbi:MAG: pentapeptide repeat-containing protein [Dolichospermum sp. DEX182a]|nr:pentapeptide repeat-containing protein [Dolichospermum sp. DEX182a]